jgi:hypothetical protein
MSSTIIEDLHKTVIAGWHSRLTRNESPRRNHWQTKIVYFRSAANLLAAQPAGKLTWKTVVDGARPHGRRSTFYEVAGGRARHRMIDDLIGDGSSDSLQLALCYLRADPVEQLIDETKVWSFWPYRQRLLTTGLHDGLTPRQMEDELRGVVTRWARDNAGLATAIGLSPPACAVEDLVLLHRGRLAAAWAAVRLTEVLKRARSSG